MEWLGRLSDWIDRAWLRLIGEWHPAAREYIWEREHQRQVEREDAFWDLVDGETWLQYDPPEE